jgi:hypothetical protein
VRGGLGAGFQHWGGRESLHGVEHEVVSAAVFYFCAVGAEDGEGVVAAGISLGDGDVAVLIGGDGEDVQRRGEAA